MKRPWKVIRLRTGLTYDIVASCATLEGAERALERKRAAFTKARIPFGDVRILDPTGKLVGDDSAHPRQTS